MLAFKKFQLLFQRKEELTGLDLVFKGRFIKKEVIKETLEEINLFDFIESDIAISGKEFGQVDERLRVVLYFKAILDGFETREDLALLKLDHREIFFLKG